jgi:hypothetical protein
MKISKEKRKESEKLKDECEGTVDKACGPPWGFFINKP